MKPVSGREQEQELLQKMLESPRAEFLALYGRRRIGKTHLIRTHFQSVKNCYFFDVAGAKDTPMQEQIKNFTQRISEVFHDGIKLAIEKNWNDTFRLLTESISRQSNDKKIVLFFDEFPWMATKNSRVLQNLDYYWNQYWSKDPRIKLVVCGSSASWIITKIVNNKGGLHNRITRNINLQPFNLLQTKTFLRSLGVRLNNQQILTLFMVTGGIPYYLVNIEKGMSAMQIIDTLAFKKNALLLNEFDNLFASLFDNHDIHIELIRYIAKYRYGVQQENILKHFSKNMKGKKGLETLRSLVDAGFITSFRSIFNKRKGIYYRVTDEYTLFYLKWIEPVRSTLANQSFDDGYWQTQANTPSWQSWSGYAFEAVCYKHIKQIKSALKLSPADIPDVWQYTAAPGKEEQGAQIDLLFDRHDDAITICEVKYSSKPYLIDKKYSRNLLSKLDIFKKRIKTKKQLFLALVTVNGVKANTYSDDLVAAEVTLDDIFK